MSRSLQRLSMLSSHLCGPHDEVCIVASGRSPIASYRGEMMNLSATDIAAETLKGIIAKYRIQSSEIQELILGNVLSANLGQSPARQVALKANLPVSTICSTVNKVCASGLKAIMLGASSISQGLSDCVAVGGTESMSNVPYYLPGARFGYTRGDQKVVDGVIKDGLWDPLLDIHMGECAERCAEKHNISREEMDRISRLSYSRAESAWLSGKFSSEVIPIPNPKSKPSLISMDSLTGKGLNPSNARPAFRKDGKITAGNASSLGDGSAFLILSSRSKAIHMNWPILATISAYADYESHPVDFPTAPAYAIRKALERGKVSISAVDLYEINEAFAVVNATNRHILTIPEEKLNVYGGAIALGHPIGCSGTRIVVTLLNALRQEGGSIGVAGVCNGGGGASAIVIRRT